MKQERTTRRAIRRRPPTGVPVLPGLFRQPKSKHGFIRFQRPEKEHGRAFVPQADPDRPRFVDVTGGKNPSPGAGTSAPVPGVLDDRQSALYCPARHVSSRPVFRRPAGQTGNTASRSLGVPFVDTAVLPVCSPSGEKARSRKEPERTGWLARRHRLLLGPPFFPCPDRNP